MRRAGILVTLLLIALAYIIFAQSGPSKPMLRIFTWSAFFDSQVVREFEQEYQCEVVFDLFDSNELMYAKLKSGRSGYDLLTPSYYIAQLMATQQMLLPLNPAKLPNLTELDELYGSASDYAPYCAPYLISLTGIGYLKSRVEGKPSSWKLLADPRLKWRTTLLNDYRETLSLGLISQGFNINQASQAEIECALKELSTYKPNIAKFENEQYKLGLDCAEFIAVHGYSGDIAQLMLENPDVGFILPQEGFSYCVDVFCLDAGCKQVDLAHAFINFMHRPEIAARNTNHTCFLCPNKASYPLVSEELRSNSTIFVSPEDMKRAQPILEIKEEMQADLLKAWDRLKSSSSSI